MLEVVAVNSETGLNISLREFSHSHRDVVINLLLTVIGGDISIFITILYDSN